MCHTLVTLLLAFFVFLSGVYPNQTPASPPQTAPLSNDVTITVAAMGDFLMHMPVVYSVRNPNTGRFEFRELFTPVQHLIAGADYSIANLETTLAGAERGYSGYPRFNCPADLAGEMRAIGLDMFLTANNHCLDQGVAGLVATIDHLEAAGLDHVGTYRTQEEKDRLFVRDIQGIRIGIMNYTESTNGLPVPGDRPYVVNLLDREAMLNEITALREAGADIIIACLHFGVEYSRYPTAEQRRFVRLLFSSGVDIVLGNHAHVVQPTETITVIKHGIVKKKFAAYSLGNFISNQRWRYSDSGLLVNLTIKKNPDTGVTVLDGVELIPVWVHQYAVGGWVRYRVLRVHEAVNRYRNGADRLLNAGDYQRLKRVAAELDSSFLTPDTIHFK